MTHAPAAPALRIFPIFSASIPPIAAELPKSCLLSPAHAHQYRKRHMQELRSQGSGCLHKGIQEAVYTVCAANFQDLAGEGYIFILRQILFPQDEPCGLCPGDLPDSFQKAPTAELPVGNAENIRHRGSRSGRAAGPLRQYPDTFGSGSGRRRSRTARLPARRPSPFRCICFHGRLSP